jgi:Fe-S-cluster containining protein
MAVTLPLYQRHGSCEPALCGSACCTFILLEVNPIYLSDPDTAAWVRLHGIELVEREGRTLARIEMRCTVLGESGRCLIYGQPERPQTCERFPMAPASLFMLENACTYSFRAGTDVALPDTANTTNEVP